MHVRLCACACTCACVCVVNVPIYIHTNKLTCSWCVCVTCVCVLRLWQDQWFIFGTWCSSTCGRSLDNVSVWWLSTKGLCSCEFSSGCWSRECCCLCGSSWVFGMAGISITQLHSNPVDYQLVFSADQLYAVVDRTSLVHYCIWASLTCCKLHMLLPGLTTGVYSDTQFSMPKDSPCYFLS